MCIYDNEDPKIFKIVSFFVFFNTFIFLILIHVCYINSKQIILSAYS